jgi:hypothetical protein
MPSELKVQRLYRAAHLRDVRARVGVRGPAALDERPLVVRDERLRGSARLVAPVDLDDDLGVGAEVVVGYAAGEDLCK